MSKYKYKVLPQRMHYMHITMYNVIGMQISYCYKICLLLYATAAQNVYLKYVLAYRHKDSPSHTNESLGGSTRWKRCVQLIKVGFKMARHPMMPVCRRHHERSLQRRPGYCLWLAFGTKEGILVIIALAWRKLSLAISSKTRVIGSTRLLQSGYRYKTQLVITCIQN